MSIVFSQQCLENIVPCFSPGRTLPKNADPLASAIREMAKNSRHSRLPTSKVQPFKGDPRDYHRFISAFKHVVEDNTDDEATRLNLLTEYTTGEAQLLVKAVISCPTTKASQKQWNS